MSKIFNKAFWFGFAIGVLSFVIFNLFAYLNIEQTRTANRIDSIGFPFAFYERGGSPYVGRFLQTGLIADGAIILINGILVGLLFRFLWKVQTTQIVK